MPRRSKCKTPFVDLRSFKCHSWAYDKDSSFFAAIACSSGAPWDPAPRSDARRTFWLWWLDEAVPAAARGAI